MEERRKSTRHAVSVRLYISDLFQQEHDGIHDLDTLAEVDTLSHSGLSFISNCILPVGYYFNAVIYLEKSDIPPVPTTLKLVRFESIDRTHYRYGCEFEQLPDSLKEIITQYFYA